MTLTPMAILHNARAAGNAPPPGPFVMRQSWEDLLFAHWPLPAAAIAERLPRGLEVDTFAGQAWLGVVPFMMRGVHPRGLPMAPDLPPGGGLSRFPELNVRTYVTANGLPGVYFFSLDAGNALAVRIARTLFHLPYYDARFTIRHETARGDVPEDRWHYHAQRTHRGAPAAAFDGVYGPTGPIFQALPGSLEYFLVERYRLYTTDGHGQLLRGEIRHAPWPLQPASATITVETLARAAGFALTPDPPHLLFARRVDVLVWWMRAVRQTG